MNATTPCRVLLFEDEPGDVQLIRSVLGASRTARFEVTWAATLAEARDLLHDNVSFDALLLDLSRPDSSGLETVKAMWRAAGALPIIVLSGHDDAEFALRALNLGAQDCLVKGSFDSDVLIRTIHYAISRSRLEHRLHDSEQFAVSTINALSAHICVLDQTGRILIVNQAWRDFYEKNFPGHSDSSPGTNYLAVCDNATGKDSEQAATMAAGIRSVINGERETFRMEYPCHSATEQHWFVARVTRFQNDSGYVVISHQDITERKLADARDHLLVSALEAVSHGVIITDTEARIEWVNPAFEKLTGYTLEEAIGFRPTELVKSGLQDEEFYQNLWQTILKGETWHGELINRRKDGTLYDEEFTIAPVRDENGAINHFVGVKLDISERKRLEAELWEMATTDALTGLSNRRHFMARLTEALARVQRLKNHHVSVLMLDIDHFKQVNDTYGHAVGDALLKHVATLMHHALRRTDTIGRLGGEEFSIFLSGTDLAEAVVFADRLRQKIGSIPLQIDDQTIGVTVSIGIAAMEATDAQADAVLIRADQALYRAKSCGRNRVKVTSGL
ncbi:MAG: diguanylate cyclase [Methylobacter sp.]|uniref:diguanylate cyclase n=1 Tax=Methylobacter sp. TaxID=2051955 RepID=UPI00258C9C9A|nr:diguanylate cyclase [Methylobacter sp.]MCL7422423.1 diguanylate cyclase [Methylobacter sp.]